MTGIPAARHSGRPSSKRRTLNPRARSSAGLIADFFGFAWAIGAIAALTFVSGAAVAVLMRERAAA
jgi:hypothetical protein